jgi:hypothetical protein
MTDQANSYASLSLSAAIEGGFFIMQTTDDTNRGLHRPILYAGTLEQCLGFIRAQIVQ